MHPRVRPEALEPARRALAEGRYEAAFAFLEHAADRADAAADRAFYQLHLAAADALYGPGGLDRGLHALREAAAGDPAVVRTPLYRALHWEFRALQGAGAHEVRRGVARIGHADPVAAYHAASALWRAGAARTARKALTDIDAATLPTYLRWRCASLRGHAWADAGEFGRAADAYERAFTLASGAEREPVRVHWARALLDLGRPGEVRDLLDGLDPTWLEPHDVGVAFELLGRADLELGNPVRALERLDAADATGPLGSRRFAVAQARAQVLGRLGRHEEAAHCLAGALADAPEEDRAYALHEQAVALLEADLLDAAEAVLEELLLDPDYPHHTEATADLAEVRLRRGDLKDARETAARALDAGAAASACLTLGTVAYEYFDLDEATLWLERAVSASRTGDPTWVAAHQLLADVHAQRGPQAAELLLMHARQALAYTEPGSEWAAPLEQHVARARTWLGGADRWLN